MSRILFAYRIPAITYATTVIYVIVPAAIRGACSRGKHRHCDKQFPFPVRRRFPWAFCLHFRAPGWITLHKKRSLRSHRDRVQISESIPGFLGSRSISISNIAELRDRLVRADRVLANFRESRRGFPWSCTKVSSFQSETRSWPRRQPARNSTTAVTH